MKRTRFASAGPDAMMKPVSLFQASYRGGAVGPLAMALALSALGPPAAAAGPSSAGGILGVHGRVILERGGQLKRVAADTVLQRGDRIRVTSGWIRIILAGGQLLYFYCLSV